MINKIITKKIIYGNINDSIKEVSKKMKENNIGFIPIKDNNNYVGVITDRDICLSLSAVNSINDPVKSYMTNNIIYIESNSTINDALNIMKKNKIKRLLVKEKDNIIGILSISDILNYCSCDILIHTIKHIFSLHNNSIKEDTQIDEFYL